MNRFFISTMGCKSNQFETAIIKENLVNNGFKEVNNLNYADYFILNSCSVTHKSDNEAFYHLRNAKHKNPQIKTVLTGCIAQIEKDELLKNDFIDYVIGNDDKLHLYKYLDTTEKCCVSDVMVLDKFNEVELRDTSKTRASLKIQDGCDSRCAYCIIWKARGKSRSATSDFIIKQINGFANAGFKEVVLTGIHIGQWGKDFGLSLVGLLKDIETKTSINRYRLGSLNPNEINDELLEFLQKSDRFCPHFHLSLQSANDKTLRSMNRFYQTDFYLRQIEQINDMFDLPFLGSDIIAGFAGESDEDFAITRHNLEKSGLTQIHTFPYSIRKGTIGENMQNQVSDVIKVKRANIVKEISRRKYNNFVNKNLGRVHEVLIEKHRDRHNANLKGVTRNYLTVQIVSERDDLFNTLQKVQLTEFKDGVIYGKLLI